MGHAVDAQIKFNQKLARLPQFGGWIKYNDGQEDMRELAEVFLKRCVLPPSTPLR